MMTPEQRRIITNGIWLCRRCARLIDRDERRFSVDVLYRWKEQHEERIRRAQGGGPEENERRLLLRNAFKGEPAAALQLVLDEPEYWHYLAMVELLRERVTRYAGRRQRLRGNLCFLRRRVLSLSDFPTWLRERGQEIQDLSDFLNVVAGQTLGPAIAKSPPDAIGLLDAANLLGEVCEGLCAWDGDVKSAIFPPEMADLQPRILEWTDSLFEQIARLPVEMAAPLEERVGGRYHIELQISAHPTAEETIKEAFDRLESLEAG
jgi:hypothetical protein